MYIYNIKHNKKFTSYVHDYTTYRNTFGSFHYITLLNSQRIKQNFDSKMPQW